MHRSASVCPGSAPPGTSVTVPSSWSTVNNVPGGNAPSTSGGNCTVPSPATTAKSWPPRPSAPTRPSRIVTARPNRAPTSPSCVTTTTVVPRSALTVSIAANTSSRPRESNCEVGSSTNNNPGDAATPTANAARCRAPGANSATAQRPGRPSPPDPESAPDHPTRSRGARRPPLRQPHVALDRRIRQQIAGRPLQHHPDLGAPQPGHLRILNFPRSNVPTFTRPADGRINPANSATNVDLPDPDGPTNANISPGPIDRSTPERATTSPALGPIDMHHPPARHRQSRHAD